MFKLLGIKTQIGIAFGSLVTSFVLTLLVVGTFNAELSREVHRMERVTLPNALLADEMDLARSEVQQFLTDVSATHDPAGYKDAKEANERFQKGIARFKDVYRDDAPTLQQLVAMEADFNKLYAIGQAMAQAYIEKGMEAGNVLMKGTASTPGFDQASESIKKKIDAFRAIQVQGAKVAAEGAVADAETVRNAMLISGAVAIFISLFFGVLIVRAITLPMAHAVQITREVASGDLSQTIDAQGDNETAQLLRALKDMQTRLIGIVTNVRRGAQGVADASTSIAQSDHDLSDRTDNQAASLEQTTAAVHDLSDKIRQNAGDAQRANTLALNASTIAAKGGEVVLQVVDTMKGINASSRKIADIIAVIDGIAFQTNILALNAAVEAARAGEQGRGFAVVASEVRSLAGRSAEAAREIKQLISASVERVEQGTTLVDHAGATMTEVVGSIREVTDLMGEISTHSREQSDGVSQLGDAITLMDEMTQKNADMVQEMAVAANSLKEQAAALVTIVQVFKTE